MKPADLPYADQLEHGTRARYTTGCRCSLCKKANTDYVNARAQATRDAAKEAEPNTGKTTYKTVYRTLRDGSKVAIEVPVCPGTGGNPCVAGGIWLRGDRRVCLKCAHRSLTWNGLVPADKVRAHLKYLSRWGVGYEAVADAACVGRTTLVDVMSGKKKQIRAQSEKKVLAVDKKSAFDNAYVPSGATKEALRRLMKRGFSRSWISKALGYKSDHQLTRNKVTARNAYKMVRLTAMIKDADIRAPKKGIKMTELEEAELEYLKRRFTKETQ